MLRLGQTLKVIWLNMNTNNNSNMEVSTNTKYNHLVNIPTVWNTSTSTDINTITSIQNKVLQIVFVSVPKYGIVLVVGTNDV